MNQYIDKNRFLVSFCLSLSACLSFCSCKKFVEVPLPPNEIVSAAVFADSADATSAILGIYVTCVNSRQMNVTDGGLSLYTGFSGDELVPTSTNNTSYDQFYMNSLISNNSYNDTYIWALSYQVIYQTNACIEGIENNNALTSSLRNQLLAEAKFMRAFFYFNLVNLYGSVPLVISTNYSINAVMARSSVDSIYAQMVNDLSSAEILFPSNSSLGAYRPNYLSTQALLAKVYLYSGQWANAISATTTVINSGAYTLQSNLNDVFLEGSGEAIWQMVPVIQGLATTEGFFYLPSNTGVVPRYTISNYLLGAFEQGDLRRASWLDSNVVGGKVYYYPDKYKLGSYSGSGSQEAYTILRLSDQYLIRAEAEAQTDDIADAVKDLDTIRVRAGLLDYSGATDKASLLNAIYHERQVELFCECGNRWFDMKRTSTVSEIMGGSNGVCASKGGSWLSTDELYPIPLSQITANPSLIQNNGY